MRRCYATKHPTRYVASVYIRQMGKPARELRPSHYLDAPRLEPCELWRRQYTKGWNLAASDVNSNDRIPQRRESTYGRGGLSVPGREPRDSRLLAVTASVEISPLVGSVRVSILVRCCLRSTVWKVDRF